MMAQWVLECIESQEFQKTSPHSILKVDDVIVIYTRIMTYEYKHHTLAEFHIFYCCVADSGNLWLKLAQ